MERNTEDDNISLENALKILTETFKLCLKIKAKKTYKRIKKSSNKKWFDCECRLKRHKLRKVPNGKHRDPFNSESRERYHKTLNHYKKLLDKKERQFQKQKNITTRRTSFKSWQSLHSIGPTNSKHEHEIHRELNSLENEKEQFTHFDYEITEREIRQAAEKLKNKKPPFVDKIRNEMIKASLEPLMPVYVKPFNLILQSGKCQMMSRPYNPNLRIWWQEWPNKLQGICVSSCLGKLFCSILNRRLHLYFEENKTLHNSQIGFLPENRTADHVFTLRTLIDKYVHYHKEKA